MKSTQKLVNTDPNRTKRRRRNQPEPIKPAQIEKELCKALPINREITAKPTSAESPMDGKSIRLMNLKPPWSKDNPPPPAAKSFGFKVKANINSLADKSHAELRAIADDPSTPAAKVTAAKRLLDSFGEGIVEGPLALKTTEFMTEHTDGKAVQSIQVNQTSQQSPLAGATVEQLRDLLQLAAMIRQADAAVMANLAPVDVPLIGQDSDEKAKIPTSTVDLEP